MGDFNINLLNYQSRNDTNEFINSMVSHHMLPQILQPTRVTDHSATVTDNIFTNATNFETISGNIPYQIAEHFSQFLILRKINANYKKTQLIISMITQISMKTIFLQIFLKLIGLTMTT